MELDNVQFVKLYQNARDVIEKLKDTSVKKVAVVGADISGWSWLRRLRGMAGKWF